MLVFNGFGLTGFVGLEKPRKLCNVMLGGWGSGSVAHKSQQIYLHLGASEIIKGAPRRPGVWGQPPEANGVFRLVAF